MDNWKDKSESLLTAVLKGVNLLKIHFLYKHLEFWWGLMFWYFDIFSWHLTWVVAIWQTCQRMIDVYSVDTILCEV